MQHCKDHQQFATPGFTLVEFIIVIVISGIVATMMGTFISQPMQSYIDLNRRAALVDIADITLRRIARDVRRALPNSVRTTTAGSVEALEMLNVIDAARYRDEPTGDPLDFSSADAQFDVLGHLQNLAALQTGANCRTGNGHCIIVYNTGAGNGDAYAVNTNMATLASAANLGIADQLTITNAALTGGNPAFPTASPGQRFFVVDTPISFLCDTAAGTITRYWNYNIFVTQQTSAAALIGAGANSALLANNVTSCSAFYQAGVSQRTGLITLELTITSDNESVTLLHQSHVDNVP